MKLSKITLSAIISISALSTMQAHSEEWPWDKATQSTAWIGSAQIIPSSKYTITGADGAMTLQDGELILTLMGHLHRLLLLWNHAKL